MSRSVISMIIFVKLRHLLRFVDIVFCALWKT